MPPGWTAVLPLTLTHSGLEEQGEPWPLLEAGDLEVHPSPCRDMLGALGQVLCPSNPCVLIYRAGINTHILPLRHQLL